MDLSLNSDVNSVNIIKAVISSDKIRVIVTSSLYNPSLSCDETSVHWPLIYAVSSSQGSDYVLYKSPGYCALISLKLMRVTDPLTG